MPDRVNDPSLEFSNWLHEELVANYANETEAWALDRVARVMACLNDHRRDRDALEAIILWIPIPTVFTTVGKYVYISRALLERLPSDDAAAFWLAHEAAHHDLGHLDLFGQWARWIPRISGAGYLAAIARLLEYRAYGPEKEADADAYAVELCVDAGYNGEMCLQAFDIMENLALDRGDIDGVFGPENLLDPTDPDMNSTTYGVQRWLWTRARGYLPLRERRERAKLQLERRRTRDGRRA